MIPKNKRRTIKVNGEEYEYCITGCVNVYIRNLRTKGFIHWYQEWKSKWKQSVKPSDIRELIIMGSLFGTKASQYKNML
jgi:hypothetical protein